MSIFERCKNIKEVIVPIYNIHDYELLKTISDLIKENDDFSYIDVSTLSYEEMNELGFRRWNSESHMMLIPMWLFNFIDPELEVICISNEVVKFKDADDDHRGGLLAYGVIPNL